MVNICLRREFSTKCGGKDRERLRKLTLKRVEKKVEYLYNKIEEKGCFKD